MADLDTTAAAAAAPEKKPTILFIDDDLRPPRYGSLPQVLQDTLADINSPDLAVLWELGRSIIALPEFSSLATHTVLTRVQQDDFVIQVLLSTKAYDEVSEDMRRELDSVRLQRKSIEVFADSVRKAFPDEAFDLKEFDERPTDKKSLLQSDLLILDLFMRGGDPLTSIKTFLTELAKEAGHGEIPPILLVSLHDDVLKQKHLDIRSTAHISASGLFVLSKTDIAEPTGHFMLSALWTQLRERRSAATKMRALCLAVNAAFDDVKRQTMQTLWSLDVASMHQIYVTARTENDSYDEHVLELLARELLWHFETDEPVKVALGGLNAEFLSSIKETESKPDIIFRYPSFVGINMEALRTLVNHHSCTPLLPPKTVTDLNATTHPWGIPSVLPFGAIITSSTFVTAPEVLINITPLCDLIKKKILSESLSLTFVTARAHRAQTRLTSGSAIVVQGVVFDGHDFDLEVFPNRTLSCDAKRLLQVAKTQHWKVKARLRADVAKQIQQEVASHLSRRDALSSTRGNEVSCRVCIKIGKSVTWYADDAFAQGRNVMLSNTGLSKHHILDQEAFAVSTWAAKVLTAELGEDPFGKAPFVSELCEVFQMGVEKSQAYGSVQLKVDSCAVLAMEAKAKGETLTKGVQALLLMLLSRAA